MKIVAVDDDPLMLALISGALQDVGYEDITLVATAQEAFEVFSSPGARFDCVLLDIMMPDFNGIELCNWLRSQEQYRSTHVIMVTGKSDKADIDRAYAAGATDYLAKPFEVHQLCARIRAIEAAVRAERHGLSPAGDAPSARIVIDHGRVDFSDPITIPDVKAALSYNALANHVLRLPKLRLHGSHFFAFKIEGIGRYYAQSTVQDYVAVLRHAAETISFSLDDADLVFAYAGEGVFVCVARAEADRDLDKVEKVINRKLGEKRDFPAELQVWSGAALRGGTFRSGQSALSVLQKAVESAVNRVHASRAATENVTPPKSPGGLFSSSRPLRAQAS